MRIIAGSAKGHTIQAPKGLDTRPTLDRVRESVFNVLAHRGLYGKRVLDLFSGTGAVAIEALSRGAAGSPVSWRNWFMDCRSMMSRGGRGSMRGCTYGKVHSS